MNQKNQEFYSSALEGVLGNALSRASRTLATQHDVRTTVPEPRATCAAEPKLRLWDLPGSTYNGNPALTPTALAHSQWSHIIRPGVDSAIDATCGNGYDSVYLAKMLFAGCDSNHYSSCKSELVCVDIQEQACENTRNQLAQWLDPSALEERVQIVHSSHSPLPRPRDSSSVGLVVWNLGYLPKSNEKDVFTQMESTVSSIVDAALLIRVGGMLSITSYPKSNPTEDYAVHSLVEALALLSSKETDWHQFIAELGPGPSGDYSVRDAVQAAIDAIVDRGTENQKWRVFNHKVMGRPLSPILLTATRIK